MTFTALIFFVLASMGLTHIIVDSSIMEPIRNWIGRHAPSKLAEVVNCYQCMGFWCGLLCGAGLFETLNPVLLLGCGFAGSWLGLLSISLLSFLGSKEDEDED